MQRFLFAAALSMGLVGATLATSGPSYAGGYDRSSHGRHQVYNPFGVIIYGSPQAQGRHGHHRQKHAYRHGYRQDHGYRREHRRGYSHFVPPWANHRHGWTGPRAARPCHQTSKIGFDNYGQRARIGGVMCYTAHGTPYIVRGSQFIIHYF